MSHFPILKIMLVLSCAGVGLAINLFPAWGHMPEISTAVHAKNSAVSRSFTGEYPESVGARCTDVPYGKHKGVAIVARTDELFVSPPNPNGPVIVDLGLFVDTLGSIDESNNSYKLNGFMDLIWCDGRQSYDTAQTDTKVKIFLEADAQEQLNHMWWPDLDFKNELEPHAMKNVELLVHPDGTMEFRCKFAAHLASDFHLKAFPFDKQQLHLNIDSFTWASDTLVFHQQKNMVGFSRDFTIPEWHLIDIRESVQSKKEIRDRSEFSEFVVNIAVERDPGVYLVKVILPLAAIVLLNMMVLWMQPDEFEGRFGVAMTGLLAAVAYQYIASGNLPRHIYNTYIDAFVGLSFITLLVIIAESGWVSRLAQQAKAAQIEKTDHIARVVIPIFYIGGTLLLYWLYV